ncbi:HAD-IIIC family phosphatase [Rhizobacter sp. LjRoot28]|uniref:HAD-IIIC family phosphatase n=1 Tax=Rhizobacter sp. LjRoot28 TaxID=3342309 RepID=UPI003ECD4307
MSNTLYSDLAWLPKAPDDFTAQCRALADAGTDLGRQAQRLANHGLDENQLNKLSRAIQKAQATQRSLAPLTPFRLGLISNATSHFIVPALVATAARHGIALECIEADYDQVMQTALSPDSVINRAQCDAVLVAVDHRGLPLTPSPGDPEAAQRTVDAALGHLNMIRNGIRSHGKALAIVQTIPRPVESSFGSFDLALSGTTRQLIDEVNRGIGRSIPGSEDLLFDVAHLAETVGLADWHDVTLWNMAKLPFASRFLPLYADHVCRLIAALRGKSRKCLILDLDNTVWGGVIGDDGLEGIVIGQGDATGEAHLHVQRTALALRDRGIVLAVSSKNTDDVARRPFREHPEMLLREDHLAVFQANWNDKATNIKAIAEELSLGLDAMVFLDDNPMERDLVRRMLPQVAVPELPADPALYVRTLLAAGYFEAIAYSGEDRKRAEFYQDNARRVSLQKQAGDVDAYLASLNMRMTLQPFDETGRARIAQLINKSNQFNLTTRRYTEADVAAAQNDPDAFTLQVRLADTFGDNGMISVILCRRADDAWDIDTWLMSCRVLGRKVEQAVLQELLAQARHRGIRRLVGSYLPTEKNKLVEDHYAKLGFDKTADLPGGGTVWTLDVASAPQLTFPITIERIGFSDASLVEPA